MDTVLPLGMEIAAESFLYLVSKFRQRLSRVLEALDFLQLGCSVFLM